METVRASTVFLDRKGREESGQVGPNIEHGKGKLLGQVFTPPEIARFMASRFVPPSGPCVRVLDPGSGEGALSEALVERLLQVPKIRAIHIDAYELDAALAEKTASSLKRLCNGPKARGIQITYDVQAIDFLTQAWVPSNAVPATAYDLVITNPPYSKIRKSDYYARMARELIHGQPNIYGLFLALACRLLKPGGQLVAIAPRSWMSGGYFTRVRSDIIARVNLEQIHAFRCRDDAFNGDGVLQETTIVHATSPASGERPDVRITVSSGIHDILEPTSFSVPWSTLAPWGSPVIRLPETLQQLAALRTLDSYPARLHDFGLDVSTGPVVPFRATRFLEHEKLDDGDVPLVWLSHVRKGRFEWSPQKNTRQPPFIHSAPESRKLLFSRETMVLVRRFSAKEDRHRVIACCLPPGRGLIGLENHLNVIRGFHGEDGFELAKAVANYLNSDLADQYVRAVSGTTQINAAELRHLPFPEKAVLLKQWGHAER